MNLMGTSAYDHEQLTKRSESFALNEKTVITTTYTHYGLLKHFFGQKIPMKTNSYQSFSILLLLFICER